MMRCSKCGAEVVGAFCMHCGTAASSQSAKQNFERFRPLVMDRNERIEAVIGNSCAQTFLTTGTLGNGFAVLTNKRVYFKGKCIFLNGKRIYSKTEENTVDLKDVTGTGFVHNSAIWMKVLMIIFLVMAALGTFTTFINAGVLGHEERFSEIGVWLAFGGVGLLFRTLFKMYHYSLFRITYAGGGIAFDVRWTTQQETKLFQQQLVLLKQAQQQDEGKTAVVIEEKTQTVDQVPELLMKYKTLMDQGVITPQEFEEKKRQLLGM